MILGEKILEECRNIEVRMLEVDIEVALGMTTLEEVKVGLEKDSFQVNEQRTSRSRSGSRQSTN